MPIEPFKSEILQLADGIGMYWEASGNPKGKPALYLNGGVIHYFANAAFLEGRQILKNMGRIAHLSGVLIHGRLDVSGPLRTAWQLHQRWSESQLIVVEAEGHGGSVMADEFTKAIANFASACPQVTGPEEADINKRTRN